MLAMRVLCVLNNSLTVPSMASEVSIYFLYTVTLKRSYFYYNNLNTQV